METCDFAEVCLQLLLSGVSRVASLWSVTYANNLGIALHLFQRDERMDSAEFRPGKWDHTACTVEFHRTATERGHGVSKRKILRLKMVNVAEHLCFRVVFVENGMGQIV